MVYLSVCVRCSDRENVTVHKSRQQLQSQQLNTGRDNNNDDEADDDDKASVDNKATLITHATQPHASDKGSAALISDDNTHVHHATHRHAQVSAADKQSERLIGHDADANACHPTDHLYVRDAAVQVTNDAITQSATQVHSTTLA